MNKTGKVPHQQVKQPPVTFFFYTLKLMSSQANDYSEEAGAAQDIELEDHEEVITLQPG